MNLLKQMKRKTVMLFGMMVAFLLATITPIPVLADGGSGGGHVVGDNPGYTIWFDQLGTDGEPTQGWDDASMNNMQARIEATLGKTMNPVGYGGTRSYLEIYQQLHVKP